jgi:hypothetical protein
MNEAFASVTGKIFIKIDCDSFVITRGATGKLGATCGEKGACRATGICVTEKGVEKALRRFLTAIQILETNIDSTVIGNSSCLCAFKMSLVKPVDVNSMAEDTEELVLIRRQGHKVVVDPSVVVMGEDVTMNLEKEDCRRTEQPKT